MNTLTSLREIIKNLESLDDELIIYIEGKSKWSVDSEAILVAPIGDSDNVSLENIGDLEMEYFLEVDIAKGVVKDWEKWQSPKLTLKQKCKIILYYAQNDAYPPA